VRTPLPVFLLVACGCRPEVKDSSSPHDSPLDTHESGSPGDTDTGRQPWPEPRRKALVLFQDGVIPDVLGRGVTPTIDALREAGAWSLSARAESTTISGTGWSSFLTGVHWDKHNVPDNNFADPRYDEWPHLIARVEEANPEVFTASCTIWDAIEQGLVDPASPDMQVFADYYAYDDDYFDEESCDQLCAEAGVAFVEADADLIVLMLGELDGVGHLDGNEHYSADDGLYQRMMALTDARFATVLDAIATRSTLDEEDWLILFSTDHAGSQWIGHGWNIPEHREIPLIVAGGEVVPGEIWPPPQTVDVASVVFQHLGIEQDPSWDLDGRAVGFSATAPPVAALDSNLVFNGDAEYERGYAAYWGAPDASVAGWSDPGEMTVITYGAPDGFPSTSDPCPSDPGLNFFAGGSGPDSAIEQSIDLDPLAAPIDAGAEYALSAWLGGYQDQADAAAVTVDFLSAGGDSLASVSVGPVSPVERGDATGFVRRRTTGVVPVGTRRALVRLAADGTTGGNDGYADEIELVISAR